MFSQYSKFELPNKLRVISVPMPGLSSATVLVLVGAGSRYEQREKAGLSHFLEHMIFKGTEKRPTAFDISSLVDSVGGENNAFTSKDQTGYYIKLQTEHLKLAFDILSDTLRNSLFLKEEINRERGAIIEEINMYADNPLYKIDDVFYELMFDGNPLGWSIAGDKKTVSNINREDFLNYAQHFYQGSDMVLAVAGKISTPEVKKLAEEYFSSFASGEKEKFVEFEDHQNQPRVKIDYKKTDQAHLYFGYPAFSFHDPDKIVLNVLSAILGGGMSSRLFIQVRERRGLAYYVSSSVDLYQETGFLAARAGLNLEKVEEAVKVIVEEFEKIKKGDVGRSELAKAKEFLKGRATLRLENSRSMAEWYAEKELVEGNIETPAEAFAKIEKVTLEDIKRVAQRVVKEGKTNLAIIGPYEDEKRFLKLLS
ncbi:MAG TPA: pitrilysin family protein [Patescibacteria group bacterium]|nr:pitrilysin family protein [Patescibacteria group bacterium]